MNSTIETFENAAKKAESWHSIEASTWRNRLRKISRHPFRYVLYQISKKYPISITTKTFLGTKFACYLPDYFLMWCYGIIGDPSEIKLTRFLLKNLHRGDVVFDVGSNCGFYSVLASFLVGEEGSVHAFEPTPGTYKRLKKNTINMLNVKATEVAVGQINGRADFSINPVKTVENTLTNATNSSRKISVDVITLESYCALKNVRPSFIKLDVEGAEELVIRGSEFIFRDMNPVVSLEILKQDDGVHFGALQLLVKIGYTPHRILENGEIEATNFESIRQSLSQKENAFENFIFKKL